MSEVSFRSGVRQVVIGVTVLIIYGLLVALFHFAWPHVTLVLPLFISLLAGIVLGVFGLRAYTLLRKPVVEEPSVDPDRIEVDLLSTNPIVVQVVSDIPQLSLALRVTNFLPYDVTVTEIAATVVFTQVPVELSLKKSAEIPAFTTGRDIILRQPLERPVVAAIDTFFSRDEDMTRAVYVSVELCFQCAAGFFRTRPVMIQRYLPETLSIRRWNPSQGMAQS